MAKDLAIVYLSSVARDFSSVVVKEMGVSGVIVSLCSSLMAGASLSATGQQAFASARSWRQSRLWDIIPSAVSVAIPAGVAWYLGELDGAAQAIFAANVGRLVYCIGRDTLNQTLAGSLPMQIPVDFEGKEYPDFEKNEFESRRMPYATLGYGFGTIPASVLGLGYRLQGAIGRWAHLDAHRSGTVFGQVRAKLGASASTAVVEAWDAFQSSYVTAVKAIMAGGGVKHVSGSLGRIKANLQDLTQLWENIEVHAGLRMNMSILLLMPFTSMIEVLKHQAGKDWKHDPEVSNQVFWLQTAAAVALMLTEYRGRMITLSRMDRSGFRDDPHIDRGRQRRLVYGWDGASLSQLTESSPARADRKSPVQSPQLGQRAEAPDASSPRLRPSLRRSSLGGAAPGHAGHARRGLEFTPGESESKRGLPSIPEQHASPSIQMSVLAQPGTPSSASNRAGHPPVRDRS